MILGVIAAVFIVVAIIYLVEPAKSLPSFIPGHIAGSTGHNDAARLGSAAAFPFLARVNVTRRFSGLHARAETLRAVVPAPAAAA